MSLVCYIIGFDSLTLNYFLVFNSKWPYVGNCFSMHVFETVLFHHTYLSLSFFPLKCVSQCISNKNPLFL